MSIRRTLKPATIEQTIAAINAESLAAEIKRPAISPEKLRGLIGAGSFGVMFAAQALSNKDADADGIDDYFAGKLQQIALEMQSYAITGKLPNGFAG